MVNLDITTLMIVIGVLVFFTNVIVEVIKRTFNVAGSDSINKVALTVGVLLSVLSYFIYIGLTCGTFIWYYLIGAIVFGFVIALISMVGWDKVIKMWQYSKGGNM